MASGGVAGPGLVLAATGSDAGQVLLELGLVFLALAAIARLSRRVGLSPIPFFLLTGLLLRDGSLFDLTASDEFLRVASQLGIVLLLLLLGLEYSPDELMTSLRDSRPAGLLDLALNAVPGVAVGLLLGWSPLAAVFLGGVTYVSSSGIVAKVLGDLGRLGNRETPSVLALLVFEDLAMAVYLPVVTGLAVGGSFGEVSWKVAVAVAAVTVALYVALRHGDRLGRLLFDRSDEVLLFSVLGLALLIAGGAERLHVSAAVGAFLVGIAVSGPAARNASALLSPLRDLFAGAFFVVFTFTIEPSAILAALPVALALAVVTAATKILTGWWAAGRNGVATRGRLRAGTVLVARGEFSIVIAGLATAAAVQSDLGALAAAYVLVLAVAGPILTRYSDAVAARLFTGGTSSRTRSPVPTDGTAEGSAGTPAPTDPPPPSTRESTPEEIERLGDGLEAHLERDPGTVEPDGP